MKFVNSLSEIEKARFHNLYHSSPIARVRQRSHAILLSDKRYTIN